jgi:hypothetical protein
LSFNFYTYSNIEMSKTFNKNIPYTFNSDITLPTSSNLNVTGSTHTLGTLIISNSSIINYRPVRILSSSGSALGSALHVNHNTLHPMGGTINFNDTFGLRINGGTSGAATTGCSWIFSQNADLGLSLFLHQASTNTYSPTTGFTINTVGNIGIGTTTPSSTLHITDANPAGIFIDNNTSRLNIQNWSYSNTLGTSIISHNAYWNSAGNLVLVNTTGNSSVAWGMVFGNNSDRFYIGRYTATNTGSEFFNISSSGNVGIGTSSPSTNLEISSPGVAIVKIQGDSTNNAAFDDNRVQCQLQFRTDGTQLQYGYDFNVLNGTGDCSFMINEIRGSIGSVSTFTRMCINSSGNIGIGTSVPATNLDIVGSTRVTSQFLGSSTDTISLPAFTWSGDTNTGLYHPVANAIGIVTAGLERIRVSTSGNIGIGTTTPSSTLHVNGDLTISNRSTSIIIQPGLTQSTSNTSYTQYEMAGTGITIFGIIYKHLVL